MATTVTTAEQFVFWLQGVLEMNSGAALSADSCAIVIEKLNSVFKHEIDPTMGDAEHQAMLNRIHRGEPDRPGVTAMC